LEQERNKKRRKEIARSFFSLRSKDGRTEGVKKNVCRREKEPRRRRGEERG